MSKNYFRAIIAVAIVTGIVILAKAGVAWAGPTITQDAVNVLNQDELSIRYAKPDKGSVKPPPPKGSACERSLFSVGGVVIIDIQELAPGYCVEAELWNPQFQIKRIPEEAGTVLAHSLFLRIYYHGKLTYEVLPGDGIIEACYAIPPEYQAQFYFYDFYGKRFERRTEPPETWDPVETRTDEDNRVACAFTQTSGVYALVGK